MAPAPRILVIGAGILGLCGAWHLGLTRPAPRAALLAAAMLGPTADADLPPCAVGRFA